MATEKLPPVDVEAEKAVLGACLLDPHAALRVADRLRPDDFYRETHAAVWAVMLDLAKEGKPTDLVLVSSRLMDRGQLERVGGDAYLAGLLEAAYTAAHVEFYADRVTEVADRRRLLAAAGKVAQWAHDETVEQPGVKALAEILRLTDRWESALVPSDAAWRGYLELLERRRQSGGFVGWRTGFLDLDRLLGGLRPGAFLVVGGRPGMGKTSLVECIADNVARQGGQVLFASLEMSHTQLLDRRIARWTGIPLRALERGRAEGVKSIVRLRANERINYLDDPTLTTERLLATAFRARAMGNLDLVILDYIQIMADEAGDRGNETQRVTYISRRLKAIARQLDVPLIAVSQLSRGVETRQDKMPTLADLRQSGAIEQDADAVLLMFREAYYNEECGHNLADLRLAKNRSGRVGQFQLLFLPGRFCFVDVNNDDATEID